MGPMRVTGVRSEVSAKWESRYREVLDAAAIAFAENGYLGASKRDIAEPKLTVRYQNADISCSAATGSRRYMTATQYRSGAWAILWERR